MKVREFVELVDDYTKIEIRNSYSVVVVAKPAAEILEDAKKYDHVKDILDIGIYKIWHEQNYILVQEFDW